MISYTGPGETLGACQHIGARDSLKEAQVFNSDGDYLVAFLLANDLMHSWVIRRA